jgi:plasmid stabilization system protein ParE
MTHEVVFRRSAESRLDSAIEWYESRSPGSGMRFSRAIQRLIRRIGATPHSFEVTYRGVRQAIVRGFPFAVYFRESDGKVFVLSIIHISRDPQAWMERVDDEFRDESH